MDRIARLGLQLFYSLSLLCFRYFGTEMAYSMHCRGLAQRCSAGPSSHRSSCPPALLSAPGCQQNNSHRRGIASKAKLGDDLLDFVQAGNVWLMSTPYPHTPQCLLLAYPLLRPRCRLRVILGAPLAELDHTVQSTRVETALPCMTPLITGKGASSFRTCAFCCPDA
jgi:hypothetical protein